MLVFKEACLRKVWTITANLATDQTLFWPENNNAKSNRG